MQAGKKCVGVSWTVGMCVCCNLPFGRVFVRTEALYFTHFYNTKDMQLCNALGKKKTKKVHSEQSKRTCVNIKQINMFTTVT